MAYPGLRGLAVHTSNSASGDRMLGSLNSAIVRVFTPGQLDSAAGHPPPPHPLFTGTPFFQFFNSGLKLNQILYRIIPDA